MRRMVFEEHGYHCKNLLNWKGWLQDEVAQVASCETRDALFEYAEVHVRCMIDIITIADSSIAQDIAI
jgi:hypothetical protein